MLLILASTAVRAAHQYTITVDDKLGLMTVEARFDRPIDYISARSRYAKNFLRDARDCDNGRKLNTRSGYLQLPPAGIRCLEYSVDLRRAASAERFASILHDANIAVSPTLWMWRPRLRAGDEILATFQLTEGVHVFVPWQMTDNDGTRYRLTASPESGSAIAVFGSFEQRIENVAGAEFRIVLLGTHARIEMEPLVSWVRGTAESIAATYGTFPNPNTSVILIPVGDQTWNSNRAVSFGRVVRDGGETVELMINPDRPIAEFYREWTPTHEFSHLMLPYLDRRQRWISEGFAQYYQNVLLARAGQHSEQSAWQKIYDGLSRGAESAPGVSPNDAARGSMRNTRMKVYWSGASIALMADVELRRRSGGRESLDTVLGDLQDCCLPSAHAWSGVELFRKLDGLLDEPLFMQLYRRYADADDFPDSQPLLVQLGVEQRGGQVWLDNTAELATIREAILNESTTH
jgi:hypothetical protein